MRLSFWVLLNTLPEEWAYLINSKSPSPSYEYELNRLYVIE